MPTKMPCGEASPANFDVVSFRHKRVYVALVVYMPTDVNNVANHGSKQPEIVLGVNVVATQVENESDSFGNDYDKDNAVFVSNSAELRDAITNVKDGGTVYVNDGLYEINSQLTVPSKSINIIGLGNNAVIHMTDKRVNYNKIFYIYGSATEGEDVTVNISNLTLTADIATKSDIWVRTDANNGAKLKGNVTVNLDNVTCTSVICDNNYVDGDTINLNITNSKIEKVTLDASPFSGNGLNTYTNLTYEATRIDHINIQEGVDDLTHITINGSNPTDNGEQQPKTYVDDIRELQDAMKNAEEGAVIVFGADINGNIVMPADEKSFTLDGEGFKLNGIINLNGTKNKTLKNIVFDAANATRGYDGNGNAKQNALIITGDATNKPINGAWNLVIDGCTFTGTFANGGASIAFVDQGRKSGESGNVTIKNCTFDTEGAYYDIYGHYTGNGNNGYPNFVIENNTFKTEFAQGGPIYLGRYASSTPVVIKGNTFESVTSLDNAAYVQDHSNFDVSIDAENNTFAN